MKKYVYIILLLLTCTGTAQQLPLYDMYYHDNVLYNPALTGQSAFTNVFLFHRNQWTGMPGAPQTTTLTLDGPLRGNRIGLGGTAFTHTLGYTRRTGITASYSYAVDLNAASTIRFGVSLGILDNRIDFSQAIVRHPDDPFLLSGNRVKTGIDGNAGLHYKIKNTELGFSAFQLLGNSLNYAESDNNAVFMLSRNYILSAKHTFVFGTDDAFTAYPLLILRMTSHIPARFDFNVVLGWKDQVWIGLTARNNSSIGMSLGVKIHEAVKIGYAYSYNGSDIGTYGGQSHEIMLGYSFKGPDKKSTDKQLEKYQHTIDSLAGKLLVIEERLNNQKEHDTEELKKEIEGLNQKIAQMKKEAEDSSTAHKLQIAVLEEKLNLLIKLIGQ